MATAPAVPPTPEPAAKPAKPARPALIQRTTDAAETRGQRLLKKQLPALVVSGAVHVALVAAIIATSAFGKAGGEPPSDALLAVVAPEEKDDPAKNLVNPEVGLDPDRIKAIEAPNLADVNVQTDIKSQDPPGLENAPKAEAQDITPPSAVGPPSDKVGATGLEGTQLTGGGGPGTGDTTGAFPGRGAATRSKMVSENGGNSASEAAVARGLVWLSKQQKSNGSWVYDGAHKQDVAAATAMALLPFLAAGQTHKAVAGTEAATYKTNVAEGLKFLLSVQKPDGSFKASDEGFVMYSHSIVTVALCEALGMTNDQALVTPAQLAVNFIVKAQAANGSWGYRPGIGGDTSIVGWQVQALHAGALCKQLKVDRRSIDRARKFLDTVAYGPSMSRYGYLTPDGDKESLTAVGLLCRYYVNDWGSQQPGMIAGVKYMVEKHSPSGTRLDMYYFYYATQVLHFFEGDEWVSWNAKMRDRLISTQDMGGTNKGSWAADDEYFGRSVGRLGGTCMSLLTLEVYYRHLALTKRGTGGLKELQRGL